MHIDICAPNPSSNPRKAHSRRPLLPVSMDVEVADCRNQSHVINDLAHHRFRCEQCHLFRICRRAEDHFCPYTVPCRNLKGERERYASLLPWEEADSDAYLFCSLDWNWILHATTAWSTIACDERRSDRVARASRARRRRRFVVGSPTRFVEDTFPRRRECEYDDHR